MNCEQLLTKIEELTEKYYAVWEDVCNIESPTDDKEGVDRVGQYFVELAQKQGWTVEVFPQPVAGDVVCFTMNADATKAPVTLSGHTDTVHPRGLFGYPPVTRDKEKIYGPGVTDCKGGIVAGVLAMEALSACGFTDRPVRMLLQTDEEGSSERSNKATIQYICEKAKDSIAFFNLEGHNNGDACLGRKGIITFEFTVIGEEAHSSACATSGANAIADAAYKIIELEKLKDDKGLTCNCGVISGGSVPNTVAGRCVFKANVRYATQAQRDWVCEYAKQLAQTVHVAGCRCEVTISAGRPAMELTEKNVRLLENMNAIYQAHGLPVLKHRNRNAGSDAANVTAVGIPCVECLGVQGGRIHSADEFAVLASLAESAKRLAVATFYLEE